MSLDSFFIEQFDQIKEWMLTPNEPVRCVRVDAEMKPMFTTALAKMEEDADFPHVFLTHSDGFRDPLSYFSGLFKQLKSECKENQQALAEHGVSTKDPRAGKAKTRKPARFLRYAESIASSLPDSSGALVFVLDPPEISDRDAYEKSVRYLSTKTRTRWLKFLVLDRRQDPDLAKLAQNHEKMKTQTFFLDPEEMERRAAQDIESDGAMDSVQGRQTLGLLAGFAFARKEYDKALELQTRWVKESELKGEPGETASALYNLGNTLLESEAYPDAGDAYCRSCTLCVENELDTLAPYVYTNLGVCLHRQGEFDQAFECLRVARDMFMAQNHLPGRVHVIDTLAGIYAIDGKNKKAEKTWLYALKLLEGVTASHFEPLREGAGKDIRGKLERFYRETRQPGKIAGLSQAEDRQS